MFALNAMTENFEEVTIFDKPALFSCLRIDSASVPKGYHKYEVRHDDECQGIAVQIAKSIWVNHWGTLISRDEIKLPPDGYLGIEPEDMNYGAGNCRSMREFMKQYPPQRKQNRER